MPVPDRSSFESLYAGQPRWEIGRPQRGFLDVADRPPFDIEFPDRDNFKDYLHG